MRAEPRVDWMSRWARYEPERVALEWVSTGERWTYAECARIGRGLAAWLRDVHEVAPGDRVGILALNSMEHFALFFASQHLGCVLVPMNYRGTASEIAHVLGDATPRITFVQDAFAEVAAEAAALRDSSDVRIASFEELADAARDASLDPGAASAPEGARFEGGAMILYTSGTTGRPKGAVITHEMIFWNSVNTMLRLDLTSQDITFNAAPLYHTGGWHVLTTPMLHHGGRTLLLERFDASQILAMCAERGITILWGVPTMMRMMADEPGFEGADLSSVRYAIVGGEPMPAPLIDVWHDEGVPIRQGFGMTEVGPNCFSLPERDAHRKRGSIGFPNFYVETRLVDDHGVDVPDGGTGELWMRGPMVTPGYFERPDANAASFEDGWFKTGDLMIRDAEGYFSVVGRKKDMFISGGENVYPAEVEDVLHRAPGCREVAVVGVPDARWGEVGVACVVAKAGAELDVVAVLAHASTHLARYKVPKHVLVMAELPKGETGKILKRALREYAADALGIEL